MNKLTLAKIYIDKNKCGDRIVCSHVLVYDVFRPQFINTVPYILCVCLCVFCASMCVFLPINTAAAHAKEKMK